MGNRERFDTSDRPRIVCDPSLLPRKLISILREIKSIVHTDADYCTIFQFYEIDHLDIATGRDAGPFARLNIIFHEHFIVRSNSHNLIVSQLVNCYRSADIVV